MSMMSHKAPVQRFRARVQDPAPGSFILASALDPVDEVLVVANHLTERFIGEVEPIVRSAGARLTPIIVRDGFERDLWVQDAAEIGGIVTEDGTGISPAALGGLRALCGEPYADFDAGRLDSAMRQLLAQRGIPCIEPGPPRPNTRWIDWYGNLEVSPPAIARDGTPFPHGRALVGKQRELTMHPGVLEFLERQGLQVPPLVVDTSWLEIGHVDEVVNFVPAQGHPSFRVLMPSPAAATRILRDLVSKGHGQAAVFEGRGTQCTVEELLEQVAVPEENRSAAESIRRTRDRLCQGLGIDDCHFIGLPALFRNGAAVVPNPVNSLICNGHVIAPDPAGPRVNGHDVFQEAIRGTLQSLGVHVHFVDVWDVFHCRGGEVHCGTNAIRRMKLR